MTVQNPVPEVACWTAETWAAKLGEAIEAMTGERVGVECTREADPAPADALWWEQPLSLRPDAILCAGAPEASWLAIGKHTLQSAGIVPAEPADARSTYLEISNQAFSGFCQALAARLDASVSCLTGAESVAPPPSASLWRVELKLGDGQPWPVFLAVSPGLVAATSKAPGPAASAASGPSPANAPAPPLKSGPSQAAPALDLLLEVELPVSVSFGRADLPLKEVLKLATGSIIELNRAISEPVEVIVNNCVIARGEVVVADGNYGVRIQEIVSREKRMRALQ